MEINGNEVDVILEIPNQKFVVMKDGFVDDEKVTMKFTRKLYGTIYIVAGLFEDDDLVLPFGVPVGSTNGKIAYWEHFMKFQELWEGIIEFKKSISEKGETP